MQRGMLHAGDQTADIIPKGGNGSRVVVRISPTAYLWIARYLAERPPGPPEQPVWTTLRGTPRPLTYWAMRQVLERTNQIVGSNVTMHDFRHTFCMRLAQDENMTIAEMQELMRHASIASTTQIVLDAGRTGRQTRSALEQTPGPGANAGHWLRGRRSRSLVRRCLLMPRVLTRAQSQASSRMFADHPCKCCCPCHH